jgi:DMSO reductase family type II enzyme heme b subunit
VGTVTLKPTQTVNGRGEYRNGVWRAVFKRSLAAGDPEIDADFAKPGVSQLSAFAVWNGSKGDRGGRKSISDWVDLVLE